MGLLSPLLFVPKPADENVPVGGLDLERLTFLSVEGLADGLGNGDPQTISPRMTLTSSFIVTTVLENRLLGNRSQSGPCFRRCWFDSLDVPSYRC